MNKSSRVDRIITIKEVAEMFGKSPKSIWRWYAKEGILPQPLKVNGRAIGFKESTIIEFIESLDENKK